jgi:hypothetical protein
MQTSHSPSIGQSMYSTAVKFPPATAEFVSGEKQLAVLPGIAPSLLGKSLIPLAVTRASGSQ